MRSTSIQVLGFLASVAVAATPHSVAWDGHSRSGAGYARGGSGSGSGQTSQGGAADDGQPVDGASRPSSSFDLSYNSFRYGDHRDVADEQGGDRSGYADSGDPSGMGETMGRGGSGGRAGGSSGGQGWGGQGVGMSGGGAPGASGSGGAGAGGSKSSAQGGTAEKPTILAFDDQPQDKTDPTQSPDDPPKKTLQSAGPADLPVAAIPEPASWMMMIGGMMAVGGALRSRRRRVALGSIV